MTILISLGNVMFEEDNVMFLHLKKTKLVYALSVKLEAFHVCGF